MSAERIRGILLEAARLKAELARDTKLNEGIAKAISLMLDAYRGKGKVLFCGNGGSAADAQHLAAELSGRFYLDREPLYAEALHVNTSYLTAVANDFEFAEIYARLLSAKAGPGSVLVAMSTSGNSENIVRCAARARDLNMKVIAMTGESGGRLKEYADVLLAMPSADTPRIQEMHITVGHVICQLVEEDLFA